MKKLLALLLALLMVVSLVACSDSGKDDDKEKDTEVSDEKDIDKDDEKEEEEEEEETSKKDEEDDEKPSKNDAEDVVAEYVEENGDQLVAEMEESFEAESGIGCTASIEADGCGLVIYICVDGWDDIADDIKDELQAAYDEMTEVYELLLEMIQMDLPEVDALTYHICEEDGDLLATIHAGN